MILSRFSFPSPPSALCTVFGERGLPCPVTSLCSSLSPCPVSSPPSPFFLPWGASGGRGACCCREGAEGGGGGGRVPELRRRPPCGLAPPKTTGVQACVRACMHTCMHMCSRSQIRVPRPKDRGSSIYVQSLDRQRTALGDTGAATLRQETQGPLVGFVPPSPSHATCEGTAPPRPSAPLAACSPSSTTRLLFAAHQPQVMPPIPPRSDTWVCQVVIALREIAQATALHSQKEIKADHEPE